MPRRPLVALSMTGLAVGLGRSTADHQRVPAPRGSYADGYRAGREGAFSGFDGGWAYGKPYIVTLRRGPPGITYRFARRWPVQPGVEYRACARTVCSRPAR
jgi:hypothetical protein